MDLMIISASQRPGSASRRCAEYLQQMALAENFNESHILDLGEQPLPLWDIGFAGKEGRWEIWEALKPDLQRADAYILITPEWHGMSTPALKNFLMLCSQTELGHKPGLAVSVSAADNGVYPISELRMTGTKNNHLCLLPDHLIFRQVDTLLDAELQCTDSRFEDRCRYTLQLLHSYAKALVAVRKDGGFPRYEFAYGM